MWDVRTDVSPRTVGEQKRNSNPNSVQDQHNDKQQNLTSSIPLREYRYRSLYKLNTRWIHVIPKNVTAILNVLNVFVYKENSLTVLSRRMRIRAFENETSVCVRAELNSVETRWVQRDWIFAWLDRNFSVKENSDFFLRMRNSRWNRKVSCEEFARSKCAVSADAYRNNTYPPNYPN